jgi:hypothetical protein
LLLFLVRVGELTRRADAAPLITSLAETEPFFQGLK